MIRREEEEEKGCFNLKKSFEWLEILILRLGWHGGFSTKNVDWRFKKKLPFRFFISIEIFLGKYQKGAILAKNTRENEIYSQFIGEKMLKNKGEINFC